MFFRPFQPDSDIIIFPSVSPQIFVDQSKMPYVSLIDMGGEQWRKVRGISTPTFSAKRMKQVCACVCMSVCVCACVSVRACVRVCACVWRKVRGISTPTFSAKRMKQVRACECVRVCVRV